VRSYPFATIEGLLDLEPCMKRHLPSGEIYVWEPRVIDVKVKARRYSFSRSLCFLDSRDRFVRSSVEKRQFG